MSDGTRPGEDTDIIPGLRPQDTPPMPLDLPAPPRGSHRRRRRGMPVLAQVALWGVPIGGAMLTAGLVLPGVFAGDREPVSGPPATSAPATAEPSPSRPSPVVSRADRTRTRSATPSPTKTSASPSPSRTSPSPSPSPTRTRTRSISPPPEPTPTSPSPTTTEPTEEPTLLPPFSPGGQQ